MKRNRLPLASRLGGVLLTTTLLAATSSYTRERSAQIAAPASFPPLAGLRPPQITAFVHVAVVPMDSERVLQDQTVVVKDSRIVALGPSGRVSVPAGAARVDGRGKYLIPGLADMHAHARSDIGRVAVADRQVRWEQQLFLWLAHGLTTVRIMDHTLDVPGPTDTVNILKLRARQAAGQLLGPRIYTAGYLPPNTNNEPLQLDEVVPAVTAYKAAGYDFIKIHVDVAPDLEVFDSLAATARRVGLPLAGHAMVPLPRALQTYKSIEHLTGYLESVFGAEPALTTAMLDQLPPDSLAARLRELAAATRQAGVWNCPTLYNTDLNVHVGKKSVQDLAVPRELLVSRQLVKALQDAGAGLLAGSDRLQGGRSPRDMTAAGLTLEQRRLEIMYGDAGATHHELQALVDAGLTPYQALATATRNVALYFGTQDSTGTIAAGKRADVVLLGGNPLTDIRQTTQIAGVMLGGQWLDRAELDRRTAAIGAWADQHCPAARQSAADTSESRNYYFGQCLADDDSSSTPAAP